MDLRFEWDPGKAQINKKKHRVSFEDAVKMASETLQRYQQDGRIMVLPAQDIQAMGFTPPELPDVDTDKLGDTLAKRIAQASSPTVVVMQQPGGRSMAPVARITSLVRMRHRRWRGCLANSGELGDRWSVTRSMQLTALWS